MALTPEDVSNKRFTPVRLREGYDMGEVDQFLDEIEAELVRLTSENDDLRSRLTAAGLGDDLESVPTPAPAAGAGETGAAETTAPAETTAAAETTGAGETTGADEVTGAHEVTGAGEAAPVAGPPAQTLKVTTAAEASSAAVRLLEIATRNADELVGEARADAERILGEARASAERREAESKATAERLESEAQHRSQSLDAETEQRRQQLVGELESEQGRLNGEIDNLRSFEREYRSRLKSYFEQQLDALNGTPSESPEEPTSQPPGRLQSLLGGGSNSSRDGDQG